jgi:hypothetical protein
MEFSKFFINFMVITLLIVSIFSFVIIMQDENNSPEKIIDDPIINGTYSDLIDSAESFSSSSQNQKTLFEKENPISSFGSLIFYSIISAGKVFSNMVLGVYNIMTSLIVEVLGVNPVIVSVLSAIIIFTIIIGLWIIYKVGG